VNYLAYRISLYKLNRQRKKEDKILGEKLKEVEKTGNREEAESVYMGESFDLQNIEEEISFLKSRYLCDKANIMSLPIPVIDGKNGSWQRSQFRENSWFLTNKGITEVRKSIRDEKKENLELVGRWASIFIGVIGSIIGLMAVIRK